MKLIVGLGNPGIEYKSTKHNMGFAVINALAKENKIKLNKSMHFSVVGKGKIAGEDVMLAMPQTYMNLSGKAVGELVGSQVSSIEDILVICDDINLELGKIRMRKEGSPGGHKGLESIAHTLGREDFPRLRVGIATEVHRGDISEYVLRPFKRKDVRNALHAVNLAAEAVTCMMSDGIDKAMTKFNKRKAGTS